MKLLRCLMLVLRGAEDLDIALFAMQHGLTVLTQDADFTKIYYNRYRQVNGYIC